MVPPRNVFKFSQSTTSGELAKGLADAENGGALDESERMETVEEEEPWDGPSGSVYKVPTEAGPESQAAEQEGAHTPSKRDGRATSEEQSSPLHSRSSGIMGVEDVMHLEKITDHIVVLLPRVVGRLRHLLRPLRVPAVDGTKYLRTVVLLGDCTAAELEDAEGVEVRWANTEQMAEGQG